MRSTASATWDPHAVDENLFVLRGCVSGDEYEKPQKGF